MSEIKLSQWKKKPEIHKFKKWKLQISVSNLNNHHFSQTAKIKNDISNKTHIIYIFTKNKNNTNNHYLLS